MSDARTGLFAAFGAVLGGAVGAAAGYTAAKYRPRGVRDRGSQMEDAMVIGGATGAVVGAFVGGALAGRESPPELLR